MAINFPDNPANNQTETLAGKLYIYNSATTSWLLSTAGSDVATAVAALVDSDYVAARVESSSVNVSDTAPTSPSDGDQWFNSTSLKMFVYYADGSSSQWVPASPQQAGPAGTDGTSATPVSYANLAAFPSSGNTAGDLGFATDTKFSYMWDGTEWQRMAMGLSGNAEPRWTTDTAATADLYSDGTTALTLTGVAVDEAGYPIEYSWDGFSGSTVYNTSSLPPQLVSAPVISAAGAAELIGSSNSANNGSFTFRLRASDGINTVTNNTIVSLAAMPLPYAWWDFDLYGGSNGDVTGDPTFNSKTGTSGPPLTLDGNYPMVFNSSGMGSKGSMLIAGNPTYVGGTYFHTGDLSTDASYELGTSATIMMIARYNDATMFPSGNSNYRSLFTSYTLGQAPVVHTSGYAAWAPANPYDGSTMTKPTTKIYFDKVDLGTPSRLGLYNEIRSDDVKIRSTALVDVNMTNGFQGFPSASGFNKNVSAEIRAIMIFDSVLSESDMALVHAFYKNQYPSDSLMAP